MGRKQDLQKAFEKIDKEGTGNVAHAEALEVLKKMLKDVPEITLRGLLSRFDKNNDNMVNYKEFIKFQERVGEKRAMLEQKFEELDADNSGDLKKDETVEVIATECQLDPLFARGLIDDFDLDKNGTLDKHEFMLLWNNLFG